MQFLTASAQSEQTVFIAERQPAPEGDRHIYCRLS
jgi:hypothetical protein